MSRFNLGEHYKEQIAELNKKMLTPIVDLNNGIARIVDENGNEISPTTFAFLMMLLDERLKELSEELYGERRKYPLDELAIRRGSIMDYVLINHRET
ncbi:hypothetical protein [Paenibacillus elgii]|uniref:hypothetical protein n=1 Tax=Paenibacillus elgii TaxID=189691 RepID=UPI000248C6BC|nr:hypothetical protein [Paenibacillus elgii]